MPDAVIHPTPQDLTAFGLGKLPESAAAVVAAHLESCPDCRQAVADISPDSFLDKVRAAKPDGSSFPPTLARPGNDPRSAGQPAIPNVPCPNIPPELVRHSKYLILRELGRGGMGIVYQARQTVMNRQVVIKVINRLLLEQPGALERFRREVQAAAQLSHPNIVTAYDAEQVGDLHMLVMEFVPGQSLAEVLQKKGPLPVANACHYIRQVALGLQHAHERGMVHRDIKPSNLMLMPKGQVKILDFGLAKVISERDAGKGLTSSDAYMGTPDYCAPEQATDARTADIRADVYSLGCTLYCLLAGRPPFREDTAMKTILAHLQKQPQPLPELRPDVPAELWQVAKRLLAKDPAQRYQKPIEVFRELSAFVKPAAKAHVKGGSAPAPAVGSQERGTVIAADTSPIKKILREAPDKVPPKEVPAKEAVSPFAGLVDTSALQKKAKGASTKRIPALGYPCCSVVAGVGAALVTLGLGVWLLAAVFSTPKVKTQESGPVEVSESRPEVKTDGVRLTGKREGILVVEVNEPKPYVYVDGEKITVSWQNDGKKAEVLVKAGNHKLEVKKDGFTVYGEEMEIEDGKRRFMTAKLVQQPKPAPTERALPETPLPTEKKKAQATPAVRETELSDYDLTGGDRFVHFGKDRTRVVLRFNDREQNQYFAQVYDLATGQPLTPPLQGDDQLQYVAFSPDGKRVITTSGDGTARVWDAVTGQPLTPPLKHDQTVSRATFSPDGKRVATTSWDSTARVWDVTTGQPLTPPLKHDKVVICAEFSPDGKRVATTSHDNSARVWDAATGRPLTPPLKHDRWVEHATFSPDGKRVLTASLDNTARIWDAASGQPLTPPLKHDAAVEHATFSPDGKRVVTASADNTARVWDMATGQAISPPFKHDNAVRHATFSPDGKWVVTASVDFTARLWDAATGKEVIPPLKHKDAVGRASFSPDGKRVVTESADNTARLWDAESGKELKQLTIVPPAPPKQQQNLPANASVADLRKALKNGTSAVRELAAGRLANLGPKAEPALNDLAETLTNAKNTTKVRTIAAFAIAKIGANAKPVVPALVKTLERSRPLEIRRAAAEALANITYPANKEAILDMLDAIENDKDSNVRIWCVWSLMWMAKPEFKEFGVDALLTKVLNERDHNMVYVRYMAARTLAHVLRDEAPDRTVEVLLEMLTETEFKAYERTDVKVERIGNAPGDHNVNVAPSVAVDSRYDAADALRNLGKKVRGRKDVVDALKAATKDANSKLRKSATAALKSLGVR